MKERPILFSAPMVRAVLDDSKTHTRRVMKPQPTFSGYTQVEATRQFNKMLAMGAIRCPYGQPGDRLWVREAWRIGAWCEDDEELAIDYLASAPEKTSWIEVPESAAFEKYWIQSSDDCIEAGVGTDCNGDYHWQPGQSPCRKRPSIHMPRWASRITLEIVSVRIERLQDISEADAIAEGAPWAACGSPQEGSHKAGYAALWESINGTGSWDANPLVWVVEFKRLKP